MQWTSHHGEPSCNWYIYNAAPHLTLLIGLIQFQTVSPKHMYVRACVCMEQQLKKLSGNWEGDVGGAGEDKGKVAKTKIALWPVEKNQMEWSLTVALAPGCNWHAKGNTQSVNCWWHLSMHMYTLELTVAIQQVLQWTHLFYHFLLDRLTPEAPRFIQSDTALKKTISRYVSSAWDSRLCQGTSHTLPWAPRARTHWLLYLLIFLCLRGIQKQQIHNNKYLRSIYDNLHQIWGATLSTWVLSKDTTTFWEDLLRVLITELEELCCYETTSKLHNIWVSVYLPVKWGWVNPVPHSGLPRGSGLPLSSGRTVSCSKYSSTMRSYSLSEKFTLHSL